LHLTPDLTPSKQCAQQQQHVSNHCY